MTQPTPDPSPDADLLPLLRDNDPAASETFVRTHAPRLLATARRIMGNDHDAADALQDAFISAFTNLHTFHGDAKLSTWLHRITVNTCLMKLRSQSRHPTVDIDDHLPTFDHTGHHTHHPHRWPKDAFEEAATNETRAQVRAAIDTLPENYRQVLVLRDIEGLDTDQTAELLGESPANIKTRLHRARAALRTLLEKTLINDLPHP